MIVEKNETEICNGFMTMVRWYSGAVVQPLDYYIKMMDIYINIKLFLNRF